MKFITTLNLTLLAIAINGCQVEKDDAPEESQTQTDTRFETQTPTETETVTQTVTESETQTETVTQTETETETETQTPITTATQTDTQIPEENVFIVPGKIEAEDFHAYYDFEAENQGGEYRLGEGVDIQNNDDVDQGYNVAWTVANEWLEYNIEVAQTGQYDLILRLASRDEGNFVSVSVNNMELGSLSVPNNGWQSWDDRGIYGVFLMSGTHTIRVEFLDGDTNFNWISIQEAIDNPPSCEDGLINQGEEAMDCGAVCNNQCDDDPDNGGTEPVEGESSYRNNTTFVGGGGYISGALQTSCDTPEGYTVVNSLQEMRTQMGNSNVKVALAPGLYAIDDSNENLFTTVTLPGDGDGRMLFPVTGQNSEYDFRCSKIEFDTNLWEVFWRAEVVQLWTVGSENKIYNLTIEDIGNIDPQGGALNILMDGRDNLIEGFVITARGAEPYGLGDAYGKGGGSVLWHRKHSVALIRGLRSTVKQSTFYNYAYGHTIFMQASDDTVIDGVYVQGEIRSTADMLASNDPRFADSDARAAGVDYITEWGYKLPTGYWMSLQEEGIRAYNGGITVVDGVESTGAAHNVTVLNSVVRHHRGCVTLVHASGTKYVENTTALECEGAFGIGSGDIVNSYANANVGPVLSFAYSSDSGTNAQITILESHGTQNGTGALAYIGGRNHNITLKSDGNSIASNLEIRISGDKEDIRMLNGNLDYQNNLTLTNSEIYNYSDYPIVINSGAQGNEIWSVGEVSGEVESNTIHE